MRTSAHFPFTGQLEPLLEVLITFVWCQVGPVKVLGNLPLSSLDLIAIEDPTVYPFMSKPAPGFQPMPADNQDGDAIILTLLDPTNARKLFETDFVNAIH